VVKLTKVAVVGIGHTKFGQRNDVTIRELSFEAIKEAINDSRLTPSDIGFTILSNYGIFSEDTCPTPYILEYAGLNPKGAMRVEAACASGSAAISTAFWYIKSGLTDIVLVIGAEKMFQVDTPTAVDLLGRAGDVLWEFIPFGTTFPAYYALMAAQHMRKYGTTEEQLAMVAVKNHKNGAMNPLAQLHKEITVDDALRSRVISWPLRLYDCCLISDGASAVVLASEDRARKITDMPVWIDGLGSATDTGYFARRADMSNLPATRIASDIAYRMAGVGAEDIDVAEAHDCFTIAEIMAYEDLGFCKKGEGGKLIQDGETYIGGRIPVNPDGGLKTKGHPIGATGVSMATEITKQLRCEAGNRQVPKAEIGLVQNVGGSGQFSYVTIYKRGS
jgi:acetyl-CoA C-acetyltransferase